MKIIPYTPLELLFFFFTYCFIGWIIESTWVSLHQKKFVNRGFMRGPFIPIYGFGAMTLLLVGTPLIKWPVAVFFGGLVACSILEYFTGALMEAVFKVRYWDYSDKPLNLNGHICIGTSLCWGGLAVVEDYFLHKPIAALAKYLTLKEITLFVTVISVYFIVDLTLSFKAAFDLRAVIIKLENAKEDLRLAKKRLDVILAYMNESKEEFVDESLVKMEDIMDNIESRLLEAKKYMEEKPSELAENVKQELSEIKDKFTVLKATKFGLSDFKGFYKRGIFLGNPDLASKKFKDTLDTIKAYVTDKKNK